jgi:hypothetical protein
MPSLHMFFDTHTHTSFKLGLSKGLGGGGGSRPFCLFCSAELYRWPKDCICDA